VDFVSISWRGCDGRAPACNPSVCLSSCAASRGAGARPSTNQSASPSRGDHQPNRAGRLGPPGLIGRGPEGATPGSDQSIATAPARPFVRPPARLLCRRRPPLIRSFVSPSSDVSDTNIFVGACISPPAAAQSCQSTARLHLLSYRALASCSISIWIDDNDDDVDGLGLPLRPH